MKYLLFTLFILLQTSIFSQVLVGECISDVYRDHIGQLRQVSANDSVFIVCFRQDTVPTAIFVSLDTDKVFRQVFAYANPSREFLIRRYSTLSKYFKTNLAQDKEYYLTIE